MAARRHWKFIVRDAYGYVIQNAKVNVYLPGTTTVFTGTAYDAVTAGAAVTNPFTTNAQGEVEAWFDTEQTIKIAVDDNSDAAYRAVDGVGGAFSFAPFDEVDQIDFAPEDVVITPHGAVDHDNATRQLYLPAAIGTPQVGALASIGTFPNIIRVTTLADAVDTNGIFWHFSLPDDWASGVLSFQPVWVPGASVTGAVRWKYDVKECGNAADVTAAGTTTTWTGVSAARTVNQLVYDTNTSGGVTPAVSGLIRLAVTRLGADGADTYAGVVNLAGIIVSYTATQ